MASKDNMNNVSAAFLELGNILNLLAENNSIEASMFKCAAIENAFNTFHKCFNTRNLCNEDVRLPLEAINAANDYIVVWLHCDKKLGDDIEDETIRNLQYVFNHVERFSNMEKCIDFLRELDSTTTRLFLITSCFYDGMTLGTVSPLADRNSELSLVLRQFKFEHHVHGHASQWSSPNYIHSLSEIFIEAKFDDDALKFFSDVASEPIYEVIWLRSTQNEQLEQRLRSVFSLLEIYDDQQVCFNYMKTIDPAKVHIYFIIDINGTINTEFDWKKFVKASYEVPSNADDVNRFILEIRDNVRNGTGKLSHCIERSTRRLSDKYAPFISLMGHLDLYAALSRHTHDRKKMKEEMLATCRIVYHNNNTYLKMIDKFEIEYDSSIKGSAIRWYTSKCILDHQSQFITESIDDSFVYRLVNRVLRTNNPDFIYPYRFFINDLYDELLSIDRESCDDFDDLVVYRGQCVTEVELAYLQHNVEQLLTLSSFTSTTIDRHLALIFGTRRDNLIGILFEIHLNITLDNTRPFAYVGSYSAMPDELEVLISMGTIFKLTSVTYDSDNDVWLIVLNLCRQYSCDIKNLASSRHNKPRNFANCKPISFRHSSALTDNRFDANLKQFDETYNFHKKNIEKTQSLSNLVKDEPERPIKRSFSLEKKHDLSWDMIEINMNFFKRKQQQIKRQKASSYPYLCRLGYFFDEQRRSLTILPTSSNDGFGFHITPRFLLEQAEKDKDSDNECDSEGGLFAAGIYDTLMVFNFMMEEDTNSSLSLKQQVDDLRHDLRKIFNLEKGRWCSEY